MKGTDKMSNKTAFITSALAALAGIFFVGGIAILSSGRSN
jgi:hypothetical protein